jgi:alanine dehydrogenase
MVDVAIDQGGCFETSKATTHADPTFVVDDVVHYCVANMPGAVARTATMALTNATLPFIQRLAADGPRQLFLRDSHFGAGLNVYNGQLTHQAVADALQCPWISPAKALDESLHLKTA